ncbi:unnamed protein product [Linum tenue]|uniref:Uncharacterized protein n=1 Tax=Linum tenue TaxID=586396 RepID=A0AAV0QIF4_9ROSI|nr:unnamed protein product [Linum tenue]
MGSLSEEEFRFFDAADDIASTISGGSSDIFDCQQSLGDINSAASSPRYALWADAPKSVEERRNMFLKWMEVEGSCPDGDLPSPGGSGINRMIESSGAVLRNSCYEGEFCSTRSSSSILLEELGSAQELVGRDGNSGGGLASNVDESHDLYSPYLARARECSSKASGSLPSSLLQLQPNCERSNDSSTSSSTASKADKKRWLSRLRSMACAVDGRTQAERMSHSVDDSLLYRTRRVKVRQSGKQVKELSALYSGQDIQAHRGSILAMKFSPDGQYLASAGEDGIVRVWQVLEDDRSNERDIPEIDPSCIYFTVDHLSELKPLISNQEKTVKMRSLRKTSDSACVIFPPKVFRILEDPLHEFVGHSGDILDLSWSNDSHLLSASVDKTVRLWQVGCNRCLGIYSHSNYVTCVQFNPGDDNYFMSGSIDGKVRIWAISGCQVVDWVDIKEIVTAACYRPDGQGLIVGSMTGTCRLYNRTDNRLQLDAQVCLNTKKKSPGKRITAFQYSPQDSDKVMVSCADSQVRILKGLNVIAKYKGLRNTANHVSARFTSDGKNIISACEDANVYMWDSFGLEDSFCPNGKNIKSCERFSADASVALPWSGFKKSWNSENGESLPFSSPASFNLGQEYYLESYPKGSATWPEEKLPRSSPSSATPLASMHKSQYKFLKASCQSTAGSHAWGLVIVTAGWDGRIRSYHSYGLPVPT